MKSGKYIEDGEIEMTLMDAKSSPEDHEKLREQREASIAVDQEAMSTEILLEDLALACRARPSPWVKQRIMNSINWGNPFSF